MHDVANQLRRIMEDFSDNVEWELQKRGFTDADGLRDFALFYGEVSAKAERDGLVEKDLGHSVAAGLVGGFLLGLDYCQKQQNGSS